MKFQLIESTKNATIFTKNNIIYKVNDEFLEIIGYKDSDIVGKSLRELSLLLKMDVQVCFDDIKDVENIYIFNKQDVPKDLTITCESGFNENDKLYYIEENLNQALEGLLLNFANNEKNSKEAQAIYSYPELICLKANNKYIDSLDLMGVKYDNLIGFYHPYPRYLSQIIEMNSFHKNEVEQIDSNGIKTYWDVYMKLMQGNKNEMFIVSTLYDISDRVVEKKILEKQRVEMEIILDNMSDSINKVNKDGMFTYINKSAKNKLEPYISDLRSLDNRQQFDFFKYNDIDGNELSYEETPIQRILRGETITSEIIIGTTPLNGTNLLPTTYHECNGVPVYDEEGNIDGGVLIFRDIEDIYKLNEYNALKQNIEGIFLRYASISYDNFKVKYMNEAAMEMVKKHNPELRLESDVIGKDFFDFYYSLDIDKDKLINEIRKSIEERGSYSLNQEFIEDGETKYIKTIFYSKYNEKYKIKEIEVLDVDITDEVIANIEINRTLEMQDEMFVNISHELKTPLNVISSSSQLLNMYLKKDSLESLKDNIIYSNNIIRQNCYRLTKLINNILDISKIESGFFELDLTNRDIVHVISNIIESVKDHIKASSLTISFSSEVEKLVTAFDTHMLERILLNLISNAIKFSNPGGTILISLKSKDDYIELSVEDKGIGMEERDRAGIFEKYRQVNTSLNRRSEGNGIGLFLVKSIVELHGGKINLESTLGQGSIFTIKLPIRRAANKSITAIQDYDKDKTEIIKLELSDIYS